MYSVLRANHFNEFLPLAMKLRIVMTTPQQHNLYSYKYKFIVLLFSGFLYLNCGLAQMKVVIMGSSTAYGTGASVYDSSWVGRTTAFLNQNTTDGLDTLVYNIAAPAYTTYQEMPNDFTPPPGRPLPDEFYNITKALSYDPDIVIINLPSNDLSYGYAKSETMSNFRLMYSAVCASGARCYITTPQPRNDFDDAQRDSLFSLVDSVTNAFGAYAVNFWDCLVTTDGQHMLKDELRATGSSIHVNNMGHQLLFGIIRDGYIFSFGGPLPILLTNFQAELRNNAVLVKWHVDQQEANTNFEVQRSADGRNFETAFSRFVPESRQSANYTGTDIHPLPGKSFYRIKVATPARQFYSGIVSVLNKEVGLDITKLYVATSSNLMAEINVQKSQSVSFTIINVAGAVLLQQKEYVQFPSSMVSLRIGNLAGGQYYLRAETPDRKVIVRGFTK
jgi:lysophospholipase L1-like esterase